jgi:glycine cleavage system H protein
MNASELRYAETHEWVSLDGDTATVGITQFAVEQLTDLVFVELPKLGQSVKVGDVFGEIESVKAVSDLYAPVAGEVIAINEAVKKDAMSIAADPLGAGWLIKIRVPKNTPLDHLMTLEQYEKQIAESH